jgi:hypothetical protein
MTKITLPDLTPTAAPARAALRISSRALRWAMMAGAVAVGSVSSLSAAEPFVPEVTFPAARATLAGHTIDILTLTPGMTPQETREALLSLPAPETIAEKKTTFAVASRGVKVQTAEFVETMSSGANSDRVSVSFTGPASDNQVFAVMRNARYPDVLSAPALETIVEALVSKYGAPSYNAREFYDASTQELMWVFKAEEQPSCQGLGGNGTGQRCPFTTGMSFYDPAQLTDLATETLDFDYAIIAGIETHNTDRTKVAGFTITVSDLMRRKQAASADMQALVQELDRVHAEASKPAAAPSM